MPVVPPLPTALPDAPLVMPYELPIILTSLIAPGGSMNSGGSVNLFIVALVLPDGSMKLFLIDSDVAGRLAV